MPRSIRVLLAVALLTGGAWLGRHAFAGTQEESAAPATVRLVIDYDNGVEKHYTRLAWREGMTVLDAMREAERLRPAIAFEFRGSSERAFLTQMDGFTNEGGGEGKRNWILRVQDKLADRSFAITQLKRGEVVLWRFDKWQPGQ
jgi:hypothetical protein